MTTPIELRPVTRQVDPDVTDILENALARAKSGEVFGLLLLEQDGTGLSYSLAGVKDRFTMLGFLAHAMYKLQEQ